MAPATLSKTIATHARDELRRDVLAPLGLVLDGARSQVHVVTQDDAEHHVNERALAGPGGRREDGVQRRVAADEVAHELLRAERDSVRQAGLVLEVEVPEQLTADEVSGRHHVVEQNFVRDAEVFEPSIRQIHKLGRRVIARSRDKPVAARVGRIS